MKPIFLLRTQLAITIFVGLGLGFAFQPSPDLLGRVTTVPMATAVVVETTASATVPATTQPVRLATPTQPSILVNQTGVWLVRLKVFRDRPPEVVKIAYLDQGRISLPQDGEGRIELQDAAGKILFAQTFGIHFVSEGGSVAEETTIILVLPDDQEASAISIKTPGGEISYELPQK
jgi:hypothetical protein